VRKGKHILGIGLQVRRECLIHRLQEHNKRKQALFTYEDLPTVPFEEQSTLPPTLLEQHYYISTDTHQKVQLLQWLHRNQDDPAIHVSMGQCYGFLLSKILLGFLTTAQEPSPITSPWPQVCRQ